MNDFLRDDRWQREVCDRILIPRFYDALDHCHYIVLDGANPLMRELQQRHGVDTICRVNGAQPELVEEKIVRWRGRAYTAFALETISCTVEGREKLGWMHYSVADHLLYCFALDEPVTQLDAYLIPFAPLRRWFAFHENEFPLFGPLPTLNGTAGRVVPIDAVRTHVRGVQHFQLS